MFVFPWEEMKEKREITFERTCYCSPHPRHEEILGGGGAAK